ncbi:transcriptional initiation protein Tat [Actinomyces sp. HMSC075C01]|uniref:VanW family protein n=1 Tax=Actinomyces TaxID=1654 RepID=UPI0008A21CA2|nr:MULTISPECIES: VanW family protein [Actinomyces]OFR53345.1 transcriptional initiation protein Tat [Actinomyces sp. HMSC075C01]
MSQSVNRGEKPAASEAAADAVEPVEAAVPAESASQAEESEAAPITEQPEKSEGPEEPEQAPVVEQPEEKAPAVEDIGEVADQGAGEPVSCAQGGDADDTPTLNLEDESQDEPAETAESAEPAEEVGGEAQEGEPAGTVEAVKPAEPAESAQAAEPAEPVGQAEESEAAPVTEQPEKSEGPEEPEQAPVVEQPEEKAPAGEVADQSADKTSAPGDEPVESAVSEPATSESAAVEAAEPVATPASTRVVDEAATPAEALSPYESAGADAAEETRQGSAWSPDSGDMPPSIAPKSLSGASPSAPAQATPAVNAARAAEPTEGDADPVGDNAAAAVAGTLAAAEKAHKPSNAQDVAKKTNGTAAGSGASRRRRLIPAACAAGAAALLLAWGGIAWWTTQHIASGTTVSGVDVSGLSPKEARDRVGKGIGDQLAQPVTLTVGQGSSELVPAKSGISVDTDASVKKLTGFTLNPLTLAQRLGGQRTEAVIRVDSTALRGALEDRVDTMANGAVSATVTLEGTKPVTTPASNGIGLDVEASLKQLSGSWPLGKKTLAMAEGTAIPAITDEEAAKFVDGTLTPLLSSGLTVNTAGTGAQSKSPGAAAAFSPQDTAEMLKISSEGGTLSATFDPTALRDGVVARIGQVETPAQNATWKIDGSATGAPGARPQYVPAAQGKVIDTAALSASLLKAGTTATDVAGRTVTLPMVVAEPTVKTPQNEWGISEAIGEFATPYNSGDAPRTQNLTRGAELVNGTVVKPGEVFSLEKTLGEVDYEHGFADAGVISNGQHVDSMGGGLSQVATTVFNAGFEAGMDDTEHHAHQYYFDRYPAGREATLWTGKLDVKFTNSTSHAVLVQAWLDGEQIHVRMWSTKYYDVSITSSDRFNFRPVSTERKSGPGCEPYSGGNPGFDITVTRTRKHDGKALPDDVLTTQYAADNDIVCS